MEITYTAGYGTTQASIEEDIKTGIKFYLSDLYDGKIEYRNVKKKKPNVNNEKKAEMILQKYVIMHKLLDGEL